MPLPIVNFGYTAQGLSISFVNLTIDQEPEAIYNWSFGDGTTSNEQNIVHTYESFGIYNVSLSVTNTGEPPVTQTLLLHVDPILDSNILFDIIKLVDTHIPPGLEPELTVLTRRDFQIVKWQHYLQPLVYEPFEVLVENTYKASHWPPLVNVLLAKLVVMDILEMNATDFLMGTLNGKGSSGSGSNTSTTGGIKSIETGPTKIERYENKDASSFSEANSNLSKSVNNLLRPGGLIDQMRAGICQDADRVRVYLPMCGPLPGITTNPIVSRTPGSGSSHNANPFGITKRML
jgi:hypothetical protein